MQHLIRTSLFLTLAAQAMACAGVDPSTAQPPGGAALTLSLDGLERHLLAPVPSVHAWTAADVYEYRVYLQQQSAAGVNEGSPLLATAAQKVAPIASGITFSNLAYGKKYLASLEAWGNNGGTAAGTQLNLQTPTTKSFDFTASASQQSGSMTAVLDPTSFAGVSVSVTPTLASCYASSHVYQFNVTVTRATSISGPFTALPTPLSATLWQKSTPVQDKATFTGLLPGYVYKFSVQAKGNADGTAPTQVLNSFTPTEQTLDLTSSTVITKTQYTPYVYLDDCQG